MRRIKMKDLVQRSLGASGEFGESGEADDDEDILAQAEGADSSAGASAAVSAKRAKQLRGDMQKRISDGWNKFANKGWEKEKISAEKCQPRTLGAIVGTIFAGYREIHGNHSDDRMYDGTLTTLTDYTMTHFKHSYGVRNLARQRFSDFLRGLLEVVSRMKFLNGKDIGDKLNHDDIPWDLDHSKVFLFAQMVNLVDPPFSHVPIATYHKLIASVEGHCESELLEALRFALTQSDVAVTTANNLKKACAKLFGPEEGYPEYVIRDDVKVTIEELCTHVECASPGRYADPVAAGRSRKFGERLVPVDRFAHWAVKYLQTMFANLLPNLKILEEVFEAEVKLGISSTEGFRLFVSYLDPELAGIVVERDEGGLTVEVHTVKKFGEISELVRLYDACEDTSAELLGDVDGPNVTIEGFAAVSDRFFSPSQLLPALMKPRWESFAYAHFKECAGTASNVVARLNLNAAD